MDERVPLDDTEYARWLAEAERAFASARVQADAGLHNWSCFASEQAAQLAAKALLHGLGRGPWGHDLVRLGEMLGDAGLRPPEDVADSLRRLSRHYIPARYPDASPGGTPADHYGARDADDAMADARRVIDFVAARWSELGG